MILKVLLISILWYYVVCISVNSSQSSEGCITKLCLGTQQYTGILVVLKILYIFFYCLTKRKNIYIYIWTFFWRICEKGQCNAEHKSSFSSPNNDTGMLLGGHVFLLGKKYKRLPIAEAWWCSVSWKGGKSKYRINNVLWCWCAQVVIELIAK